MKNSGTLLLNEKQVEQRINRLAYQIYEDNISENEIVLAGIVKNGFLLAEKIAEVLRKISPLHILLAEVHIEKHSKHSDDIKLSLDREALRGKVIILIDDVLNSGKTMMDSLKPFLSADIKKIRTVVLVNRNHKIFPVAADFSGLSLSTTHQEHVSVEFSSKGASALLS